MDDKSKRLPGIGQLFQLQNEIVSSINRARRSGLCHEDLVHCLLNVASMLSVIGDVDMDNNLRVFQMLFEAATEERNNLFLVN